VRSALRRQPVPEQSRRPANGGRGAKSLSAENSTDNSQLSVLADEIRHFRKKNNFSLEMLADASGVSRSMISKIERCETVPSTVILSKLAEA
jgi:ribosome-binding protein aMBF1 (putative translation factor)